MQRLRHTLAAILALALVAGAAHHAHAQGDDGPSPIGPPRPTAPPPDEEESPPLDATNPTPIPAPELGPEEPLPPRFGAAGVVVITSGIEISAGSTHYAASEASSTGVSISPGFDYFIVRHFSVGLDVTLSYAVGRGYGADSSLVESTATVVGAGARLGIDMPIHRLVSFYPRLTLGVESEHRERRIVSGNSLSVASPFPTPTTTQSGPTVALFAPLLIHPAPHFFVGAGPSVFHEFGRAQGAPEAGGERTTIGGRFVVGGWWGGTPDAPRREAAPAPTRNEPRFGEAHQLVLTGEASAGVSSTTYDGSASTSLGVGISPGFDYFVMSQFSLGVGVSGSYGKTTGVQPSGVKVTNEATRFGASLRMGVNQPLGAWASFWPRASVSGGVASYQEVSVSDALDYQTNFVTLGLYAPVLFHVAPHAFFGIGPYVSHDLVQKVVDAPNAQENLATSYGASLIVGGWL